MTKLYFISHINCKQQITIPCQRRRYYRYLQYHKLTLVFPLVFKINGRLESSGNLISMWLEKRGHGVK